MKLGSGFFSSKGYEITEANKELIPKKIKGNPNVIAYKLSFVPDKSCHVLINNKDEIFVTANYGFAIESEEKLISSFKVKEGGVKYYLLGAY